MSFLDNLVNNGKNLGSQLASAVGNAANATGTNARNSAEMTAIEMEIASINEELDRSHTIIGKKYVEYLLRTKEAPCIDIEDTIRLMGPKMLRRKELEDKLFEIEKREKQQNILQEKMNYEREYHEQKTKLDKALSMDIITENEYNAKITQYKVRIDNFEEIKRIEAQYEMGIINQSERDMKLRDLGL